MSTATPPLDASLRDAYLRRLGFATVPPATVETLRAVHRAQVERVPYESVWIWLDERRTIEPLDAVGYVLAGRGGYCYHQNGALATLLGWLGFDVHWHVGGVQGHPDAKPNVGGNHLALTVTGLPSDHNPDGGWYLDAGLGDGPHEPMPLRAGTYRQGPHTYGLRPSELTPGGWRFEADPMMSLHGMDFRPEDATTADLNAEHENLQTSPNSGFRKVMVVFRRDADGVDYLRGRVLNRVTTTTTSTELTTLGDWYACLADLFGLHLSDVDEQRKAVLWNKVTAAHEKWLTTAP